jgi:hypothetical protein
MVVFCTPGGAPLVDDCAWCLLSKKSSGAEVRRYDHHGHFANGRSSSSYKVWESMQDRCFNEQHVAYHRYGGRGILVCARWQRPGGFEHFFADLGARPEGLSIDRIDNDAGYDCGKCEDCHARGVTKTNCKWASSKAQARNKSSNRYIEVNGERLILADWARKLGVHRRTLDARLSAGWSDERTVLTPPAPRSRLVEANGKSMTIAEWAKKIGGTPNHIWSRINDGWSEQDAVTTSIGTRGGRRVAGSRTKT